MSLWSRVRDRVFRVDRNSHPRVDRNSPPASIETHTPASIDSANQKSINNHLEESIDSSPDDWENDYYNPTLAVHTATPSAIATLHTEEYEEDYEEERAKYWADDRYHESYAVETSIHEPGADELHEGFTTEELLNHQERSDTNSLFTEACGGGTRIYCRGCRTQRPLIDIKASTSIDIRSHPPSTKAKELDGHTLQVSREDIAYILQMANGAEYLFIQQRNIPENQQRVANEFYNTAGGVDDRFKPKYQQHTQPSIDIGDPTSIDRRPEIGKRAYDRDGTRRFHWEEKDEYGVCREYHGHARDVDGHIIRVSKDDIRNLLERASMDEHNYICLPEHERSITQTKLVPEIYTKDEINEMLYGICGAQKKNEDDFQMKLDGVYYPLNDCISWLTTCMKEMRQDIARMQTQRTAETTTPASIDRNLPTSIDDDPSQSNPMKSQPDSYTRAEIDQMVEEIYRTLGAAEERLEKRCDDIYFPWDMTISSLTSQTKAMQRLRRIENTTATMKDKWSRGDEAMRDFTGTWLNKSRAEMENCFPASHKKKDLSRRLPMISTDETLPIWIDRTSLAATDDNIYTLIDIYSGLIAQKIPKQHVNNVTLAENI
ncbi:hypothetical protein DY000_02014266 [Brassica cretica]|uniref:Uncharacterized protein n=1 Tax=Brassica cretica TaxID=69181 RepID=A0ABQ7D600_BRACR|nr:hypothetical protein DY000_02014266 [Brassica cretica]